MLLLLALACSAEFVGGADAATAEEWGGPVDSYLELAPQDFPDSPALLIEITRAGWEIRYGSSWSSAQDLDRLTVLADSTGYRVGDSLLLPVPVQVGTEVQGTRIVARGELEVWYGTFPDAVEVEVGQGEMAGAAAFAPGVGPLRLEYQGKAWELVYYE